MVLLLIPLIVLSFINNAFASSKVNCTKAPSNAIRSVCYDIEKSRLSKNDDCLMERFMINEISEGRASDVISRPELECFSQSCVCSYYGGKTNGSINDCTLLNGQKVQKAYRKEIRMLTDEERNNFFNAIKEMKKNGDYDYFAAVHRDASYTNCIHGGPAFLVWHRELTKRFEIMLRKVNTSLSLFYWDPTLENRLNNPRDSILFTDQFFGTTNSKGSVVTGPFSPWKTLEGNENISRDVGNNDNKCASEYDINYTLSKTKIVEVLAYLYPENGCPYDVDFECLEYVHGGVHKCIGGDMAYLDTSANDPIFPVLHSFVDLVFEQWRQKHQNRTQRANDYPKDLPACSPSCQFKNATMPQFPTLHNWDGLRNEYTYNMYEYAPRPICNATTECGSKYLFCDRSHNNPLCVSKVRPGGNCGGFSNEEDVCYNSTCIDNVCVAIPSSTTQSQNEAETSTTTRSESETRSEISTNNVIFKTSNTTMEDNPNTEIIQNNATDSTYTKGSFTTSIPLKITSKPKKKKTNSRKILKKTPSKVNQKSFSTSKPIISTNPPTAGKKNKKQDTQFDVKFNNQMLEFLKILFNSSPNKKF